MNYADSMGRTPLHHACRCGEAECVRILIEAGARLDDRDRHGETALLLAARNDRRGDRQAVVNLMIAAGADQVGLELLRRQQRRMPEAHWP